MNKIFAYFQGRHTSFVTFFTAAGTVLHWYHRLDGTYITFMGTILGFVLGHSTKESLLDKPQ